MKRGNISPTVFVTFALLTWMILLEISPSTAEDQIDMAEVRRLARQPVETILAHIPIQKLTLSEYRVTLGREQRPVIVFFYSNVDGESQRVATLFRYLTPRYADRVRFYRVRVAQQGKPEPGLAKRLKREFRLKSTPGVLFYDNPRTKLIPSQEEYIAPDFKTFRSPRLYMWHTYYRIVQRELDTLLGNR